MSFFSGADTKYELFFRGKYKKMSFSPCSNTKNGLFLRFQYKNSKEFKQL